MIQVVKRGGDTWEVTRTAELWKGCHEYELIGRVILDGDLYWVEVPEWQDEGFRWFRFDARGYQLSRGALRALTDRAKKQA